MDQFLYSPFEHFVKHASFTRSHTFIQALSIYRTSDDHIREHQVQYGQGYFGMQNHQPSD